MNDRLHRSFMFAPYGAIMDSALFRRVNRLAADTPWLHWFFIGFARYGIVLFALALLAAWWRARRSVDPMSQAGVAWAGIAPLLALEIAQLVGGVVDRARPYTAMPTARVLIDRSSDFSFPSDHATVAGAVAAGLLVATAGRHRDRLVQLVIGAAVIMAFSRIYVGVHYPSDVLAGLALGALTAIGARPLAMLVLGPAVAALVRTPLRPLLTAHELPAPSSSPASAVPNRR
jgi:undecaprenyl-diphosphatase